MATQEHGRPQRREGEPEPEPDAPVAPEASARKEALDDDIDTVLDEIKQEINTLLGKCTGPDVLLDFGNVEFMSSAMLGLLGQLHRKIVTGHGRLKMCNIRPEIFQVFKLTNLDKLFSIHKDAPTALATFT